MVQDKKLHIEAFSQEAFSVLADARHLKQADTLFSEHQLKAFYAKMFAARLLNERWLKLQRMGKSSFVAEFRGHEGIQIAAALALRSGLDWLAPYYRDTGMVYAFGMTAEEIFGQFMGSSLDPNKARQMPCHPSVKRLNIFTPISAIAAHLPPAVGIAMSLRYKKQAGVVLASFGDGATSEGDWHAALNLAGVQKVPIIFLCQNNRYAISVPLHKQTASSSIAIKAQSYGINGYHVDGMDILASYLLMQQAIEEAEAGQPVLIEAVVDRFGSHSSADDDLRYRTKEEKGWWLERDPLLRLKNYLKRRNYWNETWEGQLKEQLETELSKALKNIEAAPPVPKAWLFEDVFADLSPHLREQAQELGLKL